MAKIEVAKLLRFPNWETKLLTMTDGGRRGITTNYQGKAIHIQDTEMNRFTAGNVKVDSHEEKESIEVLSNKLKDMYIFRRTMLESCQEERTAEDPADREAKATCSSHFEMYKEKRKAESPDSHLKQINGSSFKLVPKCGVKLRVNDEVSEGPKIYSLEQMEKTSPKLKMKKKFENALAEAFKRRIEKSM